MSGYEVIGTLKPDNLIAGPEVPLLTKGVTIAANQELKRGSVIGIITKTGTTTGQGKLCNKSNASDTGDGDGSGVAKYILSHDITTTDTPAVAVCYQSGIFNREALIFGGDSTADDHAEELRDVGIYLRDEFSISPAESDTGDTDDTDDTGSST